MTTYAYHLTLNHLEIGAVENALKWYLEVCEKGPPDDLKAHHSPNPRAIKSVLQHLFGDPTMTSTSSACYPGGVLPRTIEKPAE